MPVLTVIRGAEVRRAEFSGEAPLHVLLAQAGFPVQQPCGGRGVCGKCAVRLSGAVSAPNAQEQAHGARLACQAQILGDAEVILPNERRFLQIETRSGTAIPALHPMAGRLGLAVDIGTTTLAAALCDLKTGSVLASAGLLNPQTQIAADVMGRIGAAMNGGLDTLRRQAEQGVLSLLQQTCREAGRAETEVDALVLTGNTTMLYLLTGRDPACLSRAPFAADTLFGVQTELFGRSAYLPPCMNAFVGADITCAVLVSGMCRTGETALLCDAGTNGELALWHNGTLYVTSTAAGPAFEGAGISCGCGSTAGAIDRVWTENGEIRIHTIADAPPCGLCGSGLIDAVAVFLAREDISITGAAPAEGLALCPSVQLLRGDIRAVQAAKAAIAAGIGLLLRSAGIGPENIGMFYLAGGFGSHLDLRSAAAIGLFPEALVPCAHVIGNAALSGAELLLLDRTQREAAQALAAQARHVSLAGHPDFNDVYVENMLFGSDEDE